MDTFLVDIVLKYIAFKIGTDVPSHMGQYHEFCLLQGV